MMAVRCVLIDFKLFESFDADGQIPTERTLHAMIKAYSFAGISH
jgi:hypothetical protein